MAKKYLTGGQVSQQELLLLAENLGTIMRGMEGRGIFSDNAAPHSEASEEPSPYRAVRRSTRREPTDPDYLDYLKSSIEKKRVDLERQFGKDPRNELSLQGCVYFAVAKDFQNAARLSGMTESYPMVKQVNDLLTETFGAPLNPREWEVTY